MTAALTTRIQAMANAHSHAFQRDLRGRAERPAAGAADRDDFWTWRTEMFRLAGALHPDDIFDVAARVYAEMLSAGYGLVGEFHYVHHQPGGTPYPQPNEMALAVVAAATATHLPIVVIPAAYHRNGWDGVHRPPEPGQRRFCDPDVETFLARVDDLRRAVAKLDGVGLGVAAHSVRAVPAEWLTAIAQYADRHGLPRHIHAHEQPREVAECRAEHGCSPIELLESTGFLSPTTSIIHGIHVSARDIELLARSRTIVVSCPTTEGNLGDGYLPAMAYRNAGVRLALGSDSQVRVDPFEETRELETGARRERQLRHGLLATSDSLWDELCVNGRASLGAENNRGEIEVNLQHADLRGIGRADLPYALATCASAGIVARVAQEGPSP